MKPGSFPENIYVLEPGSRPKQPFPRWQELDGRYAVLAFDAEKLFVKALVVQLEFLVLPAPLGDMRSPLGLDFRLNSKVTESVDSAAAFWKYSS
jgi:hypothetical protein